MDRHILIVEDDRHSREGLSRSLEAEGYTVQTAWDGVQAIQKIKASRFDAALIDLHLPGSLKFGLDGWDVVRIFRAFNPTSAILLVSAEEVVRSQAEQSGVTGCLLKPIRLSRLKAILKGLTGRPDLLPSVDRVNLSRQSE